MFTSNIQGTDAFWYERRKELNAVCKQRSSPTQFFTYSAADIHWKVLHMRLCNKDTIPTSSERYSMLINNPMMVNDFFVKRFAEFFKCWEEVLDMEWYFYRFEWQSRGSIHVHGVCKLRNDIGLITKIKELGEIEKLRIQLEKEENNEEKISLEEKINKLENEIGHYRSQIINYCEMLATTWNVGGNPDEQGWHRVGPHPSTFCFSDIKEDDLDEDFQNLQNCVERHTTCNNYCQRVKNGKKYCRFELDGSKPLSDITTLEWERVDLKNGNVQLRPKLVLKRNDPRLNSHQRLAVQYFRSNSDIQMILDEIACLIYCTKYTTKPEMQSKQLARVCEKTIDSLDEDLPGDSVILKFNYESVW